MPDEQRPADIYRKIFDDPGNPVISCAGSSA
jgi:hypothetical protein